MRKGHATWTMAEIARGLGKGEKTIIKGWRRLGQSAAHRQGWTIETMFANLKTKGFNLEDTHISDPGKLSTLQSGVRRQRRAVVASLQGFPSPDISH